MLKQMIIATGLSILLSNPSGADNSTAHSRDLADLVGLMVGNFRNNTQYTADTATDNAKYSNLRHHRILIKSPNLAGHWIFAQINKGERVDAYRQTVQQFYTDDQGHIRSRTWRFAEKGLKDKGIPTAEFLNTLSREQLVQSLADECSMIWRRRGGQFEGAIDHRECVIQSKYKDEKRRLFAEEIVFDKGMWAREGAYRMDGELAFGMKEGEFYHYDRL